METAFEYSFWEVKMAIFMKILFAHAESQLDNANVEVSLETIALKR